MTTHTTEQQLARELMIITHAADQSITLLRKLFNGIAAADLDNLLDVDALRQHIHAVGEAIFAELYSAEEMQAALAFHSSAAGQSFSAKQSLAAQRMEAALLAYLPNVLGTSDRT